MVQASPSCLDAIAHEVKARVKDLCSQQLADIVWAFAIVGHASLVLFDATAEVAMFLFKDVKSQELMDFISQHFANTARA
eukprot:2002337-Karenia_brevis.AAC.1